jgi:hypothetical protein
MSIAKEALIKFSRRQSMAWDKLNQADIRALLYGGAKGGGKTQFGCYWMYLKCCELIDRFKMKTTKYPAPVGFMGRRYSVDFNNTTLETWKAIVPQQDYTIRSSDKEIIIKDALKIQYGGFDTQETINQFNSAEYCYGFIDQAEEITRDDYGLFCGTLRRKVNGEPVEYKVLLTANPAQCWLKDEFIDNCSAGNAFIRALPSDNPFLVSGYVKTLTEAFKNRPELIRAYVEGDWSVISGGDIAIKSEWVKRAVNREPRVPQGKVVVACDPSRFGEDETVIYCLRDGKVIDENILGKQSLMETAGHLIAMKVKHNAKLIAIDSNGIGAGICDRIKEQRHQVLEVNVGAGATTDDKKLRYYNLRAEVVWEGAEKFAQDMVSIPNDPILQSQLSNIKYRMESNGKIRIESKDDIKERTSGRSPDRADALLIGLHALQFVPDQMNDFNRVRPVEFHRSGYGWQQGVTQYA